MAFVKGLMIPLIATHEPPSKGYRVPSGVPLFKGSAKGLQGFRGLGVPAK